MRFFLLFLLSVFAAFFNVGAVYVTPKITVSHSNGTGLLTGSAALHAFDYTFALRMLHHAYGTYCNINNIAEWSCKWCKKLPYVSHFGSVYDKPTDTFGYVAVDKENQEIVLAFRGSQSLQNWIDNLQFWKTDTPFAGISGAYTAYGFTKCWNNVKLQAFNLIASAKKSHPGYKLRVTGHSLGGALATLATLDLNENGYDVDETVTFGSPRVGNKGFATAYNSRNKLTLRVTNNRDIVPHLPFKSMGFYHVAQEIWQEGNSYTTCAADDGEDKKCANGHIPATSVVDHLNYLGVKEAC